MKVLLLALIIIMAASLQVTFLAGLRPWGVVPNLLLVVVLVAAVYLETSSAMAMALTGGLLADLASGSDFGLRMGAYGLVVLVAVTIRRGGLDLRRFGILAGATLVASLAFDLLVLIALAVTGGWRVELAVVAQRLTMGAALNGMLLALVWPAANRRLGGDTVKAGVSL